MFLIHNAKSTQLIYLKTSFEHSLLVHLTHSHPYIFVNNYVQASDGIFIYEPKVHLPWSQ